MEYVYAALLLHESGEEINENNLTAILEAAGVDVEQSRVKALVAALEDVDIEEAIGQPTALMGATAGAAEEPTQAGEGGDQEGDGEAEAEADEDEDEDEGPSGEGLGELFG